MSNNRNVWDFRDGLESRMSKMEAHVENIYHHTKRIEKHLDRQNGRVRDNEMTINKWKGAAVGIVAMSTVISTLIAMAIKQENGMDLKAMLVQAAEAQADKVKDDMMSALNSKEMEEKIASAINAKINLPFIP